MSRELIDEYDPLLVYILEEILFKGYTHSKRGTGLTLIPEKVFKTSEISKDVDIKRAIRQLFLYHFNQKRENTDQMDDKKEEKK